MLKGVLPARFERFDRTESRRTKREALREILASFKLSLRCGT